MDNSDKWTYPQYWVLSNIERKFYSNSTTPADKFYIFGVREEDFVAQVESANANILGSTQMVDTFLEKVGHHREALKPEISETVLWFHIRNGSIRQ